jgi:hypothetical protein
VNHIWHGLRILENKIGGIELTMDIKDLDFQQYCCLRGPYMRVDEINDAQWFFGNKDVETRLLERITSDINLRGVPKCMILGRWGIGKTHCLNHLKFLFENNPTEYHLKPLEMQLAPWNDANSKNNSWAYIHRKMVDGLGEHNLREIVAKFDALPIARTKKLSAAIESTFIYGDENLKYSLAVVLASNFLRDQDSTATAWKWLRGEKVDLPSVGANRAIETVQDMVETVMNIGTLARVAIGQALIFLIDEAHDLANAKKNRNEIHFGFKMLADQANHDLGFVLALFGTGMNVVPSLLLDPNDIMERLGVTQQTIHRAVIELKDVTSEEKDIRLFATNVLEYLKDKDKANLLINNLPVNPKMTPELLPFTADGLDELVDFLKQKEETKAPRLIIENLAIIANKAYQEAKKKNTYVLADANFVHSML